MLGAMLKFSKPKPQEPSALSGRRSKHYNAPSKTELCGRAVVRPNKEAEAMLNRVNKSLSQEGFAPVKRGVIRRRLRKSVRSLRTDLKFCPLFKNGPKEG